MCGRYTLHITPEVLAKVFDLQEIPDIEPRYNIAPSQQVSAIRHVDEHNKLDFLKWGLQLPSGENDATYTSINVRSETDYEKPQFIHALKHNRCIIPATGFYEWVPEGNHKQPYYIRLLNSGIMDFAGLWERGNAEVGTELETRCILTTSANELINRIHERMPVILSTEDYSLWLNKNMHDPYELQRLY